MQTRTFPGYRSLGLIVAGGLVACALVLWPVHSRAGGGKTGGAGGGVARGGGGRGGGISGGQTQLPTSLNDFFEPGTQEMTLTDPLLSPNTCRVCHEFEDDGNPDAVVAPFDNWSMSMMAQAARDPIWHAALAIANQDAAFAGDTCIRCHAPNAWLSGRSVPTDASAFTGSDWNGVSCNFCHRLVDPVASAANPSEDSPILQALADEGLLPEQPGNGRYVVDPDDTRRGPLDDVPANFHGVPILVSPFHRESNLCGTCHDVSNAAYTRQANGTYVLNAYGAAHPSLDPHQMMPEQRTYSEWLNSTFASGGVYFADGRFGGEHPTGVMQSCQDCHMPKHFGGACGFWDGEPFFPRPDVGEHSFVGANTWVQGAVFDLYGQSQSSLTPTKLNLIKARTEAMLRAASDIQAQQIGAQVRVRVINWSGHKLPTGYPEGRRMWLNVKFLDEKGALIAERGAYDLTTAALAKGDTKVYEMRLGIDKAVAKATGLAAGATHHLVLNNVVLKDNRIPPVGFTNSAFQAIRAAPVGRTYLDGQHWDDTLFTLPAGAARAVITLFYQTTSREYIEFLQNANTTNTAGTTAYNAWVNRGKSAPVDMDMLMVELAPPVVGDVTGDGAVDVNDLLILVGSWGACPPPDLCPADLNADGAIDVNDLLFMLGNWGA